MPIRYDAAADRLLRTANLPSYDAAYSVIFWFYIQTNLGSADYATVFSINTDNLSGPVDEVVLRNTGGVANQNRLSIVTQTNAGAFAETIGATNLSVNTWYCGTLVRSANNSRIAHLGSLTAALAQEVNHTTSQSGRTAPTRMEWGGFGSGNGDPLSTGGVRLHNLKVWTAARTLAELQQEQFAIRPSFFDSLHIWSPTFPGSGERARDYGGNGYNWTEGGTLTDEQEPPLTYSRPFCLLPFASTSSGVTITETTAPSLALPATESVSTGVTLIETAVCALAFPAYESVSTGADVAMAETAIGALALPAMETVSAGVTLAEAAVGVLAPTAYESVSVGVNITETAAIVMVAPAYESVSTGVNIIESGRGMFAPPATRDFVTTADWALRFYGHTPSNQSKVRIELDSPADPAIDVGAADATWEMWIRCAYADNTSSGIADARYSNIFFDRDIYSNERGFVIGVTRRTGPILAVCWAAADTGLVWTTAYGTADVGDNAWHHVALTWRQSTRVLECYVDGVSQGTLTLSVSNLSYPNGERPAQGANNPYIVLGGEKHGVGVAFTGRIDEMRVSNVRRYTTTFTRPGAPFAPDANAVGLFHFDDGSGTVARDASGVYIGEDGELLVGGTPSSPEWVASDLFGGVTVNETAQTGSAWPTYESVSTGVTISESASLAFAFSASETVVTGIVVVENAAGVFTAPGYESVSAGVTIVETALATFALAAYENVSTFSGINISESAEAAWAWPAYESVSTGVTVAETVSVVAAWPAYESVGLSVEIVEIGQPSMTWLALESVSAGVTVSEIGAPALSWPAHESVGAGAITRYRLRGVQAHALSGASTDSLEGAE